MKDMEINTGTTTETSFNPTDNAVTTTSTTTSWGVYVREQEAAEVPMVIAFLLTCIAVVLFTLYGWSGIPGRFTGGAVVLYVMWFVLFVRVDREVRTKVTKE